MLADSRRSSLSVWLRAKSRKSWIAISARDEAGDQDAREEEEREADAEGSREERTAGP